MRDAKAVPPAGSQPGSATEGSQAALESLKKALELPSEAPGARRLSTPSKIRRARGMAVVILDEMDQLLSQDHSVLYDLFRLPQASSSVGLPRAQLLPTSTHVPVPVRLQHPFISAAHQVFLLEHI